jgi:hypothetical protein
VIDAISNLEQIPIESNIACVGDEHSYGVQRSSMSPTDLIQRSLQGNQRFVDSTAIRRR